MGTIWGDAEVFSTNPQFLILSQLYHNTLIGLNGILIYLQVP